MTFTCGYFSFRDFPRDRLQESEDETASPVLLMLPAAGSLTARESGEEGLAPAQDGGVGTGSEMQNKGKVKGGTEGQVKAWTKEGWTETEKGMWIS